MKILYIYIINYINIFKWGLGIGDWGLGIGDWANPQSPIPNPQSPYISLSQNLIDILFLI